MFTLEELQVHQEALETFLNNNCMCTGVPDERERIMEAVTVTTAMLSAVVAQLENQSISFTP